MPFNIGDLVWAKRHPNGWYHQARIEMEINHGNQCLASWVHLHHPDTVVPRRDLRRFGRDHFECLLRAARNQVGGQGIKEE
eukprot:8129752-Ditylum_brightwellii.AAC.1